MGFLQRWFGAKGTAGADPRASTQSSGGGTLVTSPDQLEDVMRGAGMSGSGMPVTPETAMRQGVVFACVRIRSGVLANMPIHIKRRVDARTREDASDHPLWKLFRRRPNRWQTPSQFKRMLQAHLLLRGNAYAMIVRSRGRVIGLVPLHPDRVTVVQNDDHSLVYTYRRKNGGITVLPQGEMMHLVGLSLDGIVGVSVISYARETVGLAAVMENHGATTFKNGARVSTVLKHPGKLGPEGLVFLQASLDEYRSGGESEGKALILEEGMDVSPLAMTAEDAQWLESRKFSRTDISMFFGVPPHMFGDTEKSTSWGTGIDSQTQGFVTFTSEDDLTTWEETINRDLVGDGEPDVYARFNRAALIRGDIKTRWGAYVQGLQWGVWSPNEIRALEDENPREGGDVYYDPPNTAGETSNGDGNEPSNTS
tara:strand:- start:1610 stop:2881 length:1272 start_codon:yes stop_codon:yes gene_type:complete